MRNAFASEITRIGEKDSRVVLLSGDIGNKLFDEYKRVAGDRFMNCGVAEANMMSVAAGMALCGLRPVIYTIAPFTTTRCFEQIRIGACYHKAPVIIVGTGSGLSYAELGPTHHSCEDIAILRSLPGMTVMAPGDPGEVRSALNAALAHEGPVYIRIGKKGEPSIYPDERGVKIGEALTLREGSGVCLISTGVMTAIAIEAAEQLHKEGISARVEHFHTIKPLDVNKLADIFSKYELVLSIEEHSKIGGLGGAISEWIAQRGPTKTRLVVLGTGDEFMHEIGSTAYAREKYGLTEINIVNAVKSNLKN